MRKITLTFISLLLVALSFGQQSQPIQKTTFFKVTHPAPDTAGAGVLVVDTLASLQDFITTMFGPAIFVSNLTYIGWSQAIGKFQDTTGTLGMDSGIIMTSGTILNAVGPNNSTSTSATNNGVGDPTLNSIPSVGNPTHDAAVIEFDFIPQTDTIIACKMVFGSEEYPEYVNSSFNDVFGFFVSGPGFNGFENLALTDTNGTIISINSINNGITNNGPCMNCAYYVDNTNGSILQYDGYTTVIQFMRPVTNGASYHFKIAIADVSDNAFDSGIFLKSKSFLSYAKVPSAAFTSSPGIGSNDVQFTNTTDYAKKYTWDFGDGISDTASINPVHTYAAPGYYTVTLKAVNYYQEDSYTYLVAAGNAGISNIAPNADMKISQLSPGLFNIQLSNVMNASLQVFSLDGKKVLEQQSLNSASDVKLDMTAFSKGLYVVKLNTGREVLTQKLSN